MCLLCRANLLLYYVKKKKKKVCNFLDVIDFGSFFQGKGQFKEVSWAEEHSCFLQEELRWNRNMASILQANLSLSHQWMTCQCLGLERPFGLLPCSLVICFILFSFPLFFDISVHQKVKPIMAIICFSFSLGALLPFFRKYVLESSYYLYF